MINCNIKHTAIEVKPYLIYLIDNYGKLPGNYAKDKFGYNVWYCMKCNFYHKLI